MSYTETNRLLRDHEKQLHSLRSSTDMYTRDSHHTVSIPVATEGSMSSVPTDCNVEQHTGFVPWDNPYDLISHKTEYWIRTILPAGLVPVLFILGFPANILNATVFYKHGLRERINLCLFTLALADLIVVTVLFLLSAEQAYRNLIGESSVLLQYLVGLTGFLFASQFLSCVIACERCFCVVSPFKAQKYFRTSTMAVIISVVCFVLVAGIWVIAGNKHIVVCEFNPVTNRTSNVLAFTSFYLDNRKVFDIIDIFFYSTSFSFVVLVIIVVTTVITALKIHKAVIWRRRLLTTTTSPTATSVATNANSSARVLPSREVALTKMLIATSILFIVCTIPTVMVQISAFLVPDLSYTGRYYNLTSVLWEIITQFRIINCSTNFFIYYRMGSKFQATLRYIFSCDKSRENTRKEKESDSLHHLRVGTTSSRMDKANVTSVGR